jgi:hypothetical protein
VNPEGREGALGYDEVVVKDVEVTLRKDDHILLS